MAREFLMLVKESAFKTPKATPVVGTDAFYIRLEGSNAFTMRPRPVQVSVPYGGGLAVNRYTVSDKQELKGKLTNKLYAGALGQFLMEWAAVRISGTGTAPWPTTEPDGDLPSVACYHAVQRDDGTYKRRVYLGCKVEGWQVEVSEEGTIATISLDLVGSTVQSNPFEESSDPDATIFPAPADDQLPSNPYVFIHASGGLSIGSARTQFSSVRISGKNVLGRRFWANRWVQLMRFLGRDVSLEATQFLVSSPDDRASFEQVDSLAVSFKLDNGAYSITWNLESNNPFKGLEDNLALNDLYLVAGTLGNQWDDGAGTDLAVTFTAPG